MENEQVLNVKKLFDEHLIKLNVECDHAIALLEELSTFAYEQGLVYPSFQQAVIEREKSFPTGLRMPGMNIAIPHTDSKHVIKPSVIVAKMKRPIVFQEMGMEGKAVAVDVVFMLLINNDGHQVFLLQNIMNLCMNEDICKQMLSLTTEKEIYDLIAYYYDTYAEYCED